jgi:hypothetical protein
MSSPIDHHSAMSVSEIVDSAKAFIKDDPTQSLQQAIQENVGLNALGIFGAHELSSDQKRTELKNLLAELPALQFKGLGAEGAAATNKAIQNLLSGLSVTS